MQRQRSNWKIQSEQKSGGRETVPGRLARAISIVTLVVGLPGLLAACQGNTDLRPTNTQQVPSITAQAIVTSAPAVSGPTTTTSPTVANPTTTVKSNATSAATGPIHATWVDVTVDGDTVALRVDDLTNFTNTHFKIQDGDNSLTYMAYELRGTVYIRANVCPPCRSTGFTLNGDTLVCDRCRTTFDAVTGAGISGACVDYPKAAADFSVTNGLITMSLSALERAYSDTMKPGLP